MNFKKSIYLKRIIVPGNSFLCHVIYCRYSSFYGLPGKELIDVCLDVPPYCPGMFVQTRLCGKERCIVLVAEFPIALQEKDRLKTAGLHTCFWYQFLTCFSFLQDINMKMVLLFVIVLAGYSLQIAGLSSLSVYC